MNARSLQTREQPVGEAVAFTGARHPERVPITGTRVRLVPLDPAAHCDSLYRISHPPDGDPAIWTYLYEGPFENPAQFRAHLELCATLADPVYFTVDVDGRASGVMAYMAIVPEHGTIELGNIWFGLELQRTAAATEAIFLLLAHAFDDLGYRRVEWKCNALNGPSRRAAERFGFRYEGTFAQHRVVKGHNRDTAWFAALDRDWPRLGEAFTAWLQPANFDADGRQIRTLESLRSAAR